MLKVRLMGTRNDLMWFRKILEKNRNVNVLQVSDAYSNKGTDKYYRVYVEVEKNRQ